VQKAEILLAAYNGEQYLPQQLDSLLHQTWPNWHLTLSDDGSIDSTPSILKRYAEQYPKHISFVSHGKHFGKARDHFFYLMQQCQEPYMLFCDQDDVWHPDKVEITMRALLSAEEEYGVDMPLLVFTDQTPVNAELIPIASSLMQLQKQDATVIDYRRILLQNIVTGCAMGFNQALAKLALECVEPEGVIMHDWWMAAVAARFGRVIYLDQSTMLYRQHGKNSVGAKNVGSVKYMMEEVLSLSQLRQTIGNKKRQARRFLETYFSSLDQEEIRFLQDYSLPRSGPLFYWRHRALFRGFFRWSGHVLLG